MAPLRDGPIHDYRFIRRRQRAELDFINTVKQYDESAIRYVRGQSAWLAKSQGRAFSFVLGKIVFPLAVSVVASIIGFKAVSNSASVAALTSVVSPAWPFVLLVGVGLVTMFWLARFHDVETHERYEQLLEQAADLAAVRQADEPRLSHIDHEVALAAQSPSD